MGFCARMYSVFCRTAGREFFFTLVPFVLLVTVIMLMMDWETSVKVNTEDTVTRYSVAPLRDAVRHYFEKRTDDLVLFSKFINSFGWDDPRDLQTVARQTIPAFFGIMLRVGWLVKETARRSVEIVHSDGYRFVSSPSDSLDEDNIAWFKTTVWDAGLRVYRREQSQLAAGSAIMCPVHGGAIAGAADIIEPQSIGTNPDMNWWPQFTGIVDPNTIATRNFASMTWLGQGRLLNKNVVGYRFEAPWPNDISWESSTPSMPSVSVFIVALDRKFLEDQLKRIVNAASDIQVIVLHKTGGILACTDLCQDLSSIRDLPNGMWTEISNSGILDRTMTSNIMQQNMTLNAKMTSVEVSKVGQIEKFFVTPNQDSGWRLMTISGPAASASWPRVAVQELIEHFVRQQNNFARALQTGISSRMMQSKYNVAFHLEEIVIPKIAGMPMVNAVIHKGVPEEFDAGDTYIYIRNNSDNKLESRTQRAPVSNFKVSRQLHYYVDYSAETAYAGKPASQRTPIVSFTPFEKTYSRENVAPTDFATFQAERNWIALAKNAQPNKMHMDLGDLWRQSIRLLTSIPIPPAMACRRGLGGNLSAAPVAWIRYDWSLFDLSWLLRDIISDWSGGGAAIIDERGVVLVHSAENLGSPPAVVGGIFLWAVNGGIWSSLTLNELYVQMMKIHFPCWGTTMEVLCEHGTNKTVGVSWRPKGTDDQRAYELAIVQETAVSTYYLILSLPTKTRTTIVSAEKVSLVGVIVFAFVFLVASAVYSLYTIHQMVTLKRFMKTVALGTSDNSIDATTFEFSSNTEIRHMQRSVIKMKMAIEQYRAFVPDAVAANQDRVTFEGVGLLRSTANNVTIATSSPASAAQQQQNGRSYAIGGAVSSNGDHEMAAIGGGDAGAPAAATYEELMVANTNGFHDMRGVVLVCNLLVSDEMQLAIGPSAMSALHSRVASIVIDAITLYGGTVVDVGATAISAMWSAERRVKVYLPAVRAAVSISAMFDLQAKSWFARRLCVPFQILVTVSTGVSAIGTVGAATNRSFIVCGPVVATAERLAAKGKLLLQGYDSTVTLTDLYTVAVNATPSMVVIGAEVREQVGDSVFAFKLPLLDSQSMLRADAEAFVAIGSKLGTVTTATNRATETTQAMDGLVAAASSNDFAEAQRWKAAVTQMAAQGAGPGGDESGRLPPCVASLVARTAY